MFDKTQVTLGQEARQEIIKGINILADAVGSTLGPMGNNVIIQRNLGMFVTKDGVTVAKNINLEDSLQNLGAQLIKQAAAKTNSIAGDGTTTATVVAQALINEGSRILQDNPERSAVEFKRGMEKAFGDIEKFIKEKAIDIRGNYDKVENIATISTNNDEELGALISSAFKKVGEHGIVTVENSKSGNTEVTVTEGMSFDKGYMSPFFVTDPKKMTCELDNSLVLLYDGKVTSMKHIVPILEKAQQANKSLIILAEELDPQTLGLLAYNVSRGNIQACAIKSPGFGPLTKEYLHDIATLTGGTVLSDSEGKPLESCSLEDLGTIRKAIVGKTSTSLIDGGGSTEKVNSRIALLKEHLKIEESEWKREKIQERIAKMASGVAVIRVGAVTDAELQEKKYRVEDAIHAVNAALKEGIVAGGGHTYLMIKKALELPMIEDTSFARGYDNVISNLNSCFIKLASNAGLEAAELEKGIKEELGYNFKTNTFENLLETGVIDPAVVATESLRNAVSAAGMVLTTNCALTLINPEMDMMDHGYDPSMITPG